MPDIKSRSCLPAVIVTVSIFYCFFFFIHSLNLEIGRAFDDQMHFHIPVVQHFIEGGTIGDYQAAVAPGFYLILAYIAKALNLYLFGIQLINSAFMAILLVLLVKDLHQRFPQRLLSIALILPLLSSVYILPSAVWVLPDNLALLLLYLFIKRMESLDRAEESQLIIKEGAIAAILLVGIVLCRQNYIWLVSIPFAYSVWYLRCGDSFKASMFGSSILPAILALGYLVYIWEGLVPPSFQGIHQRLSFSAPAFFLTVLGCYSTFFLPLLIQSINNETIQRGKWLIAALVVGAMILALAVPTNYSFDNGRYSGLWNIAKVLPSINGRSVFILGGSILGAISLLLWGALLPKKRRFIISLSIFAFVISLVANAFVFERYMAGVIYLFFVIILCASHRREVKLTRISTVGMILFFVLNTLLLVRSFSVATLLH